MYIYGKDMSWPHLLGGDTPTLQDVQDIAG